MPLWRKRLRRRGRPPRFPIVNTNFNVHQILPVPVKKPEPIVIYEDELEALRLVDYENKKLEEASLELRVSISKVSRLVNEARKKIIQAILEGRPIIVKRREEL